MMPFLLPTTCWRVLAIITTHAESQVSALRVLLLRVLFCYLLHSTPSLFMPKALIQATIICPLDDYRCP